MSNEPVSEEALARLRKMFAPALAAEIETWALGAPYPDATIQLLTTDKLRQHIGYMLDVFAFTDPDGPDGPDRNSIIAGVTVAANTAIANEIQRLTG
jgi:hypothetical protein